MLPFAQLEVVLFLFWYRTANQGALGQIPVPGTRMAKMAGFLSFAGLVENKRLVVSSLNSRFTKEESKCST